MPRVKSPSVFSFDFQSYRYNNEWFDIARSTGRPGLICPSLRGMRFHVLSDGKLGLDYLNTRFSLIGDFSFETEGIITNIAQEVNGSVDGRILQIPILLSAVGFPSQRLFLGLDEESNTLWLKAGSRNAKLYLPRGTSEEVHFSLKVNRTNSSLIVTINSGDNEAQCGIPFCNSPTRVSMGSCVRASETDVSRVKRLDALSFIEMSEIEFNGEQIIYDADDNVTDVTIPPSALFWLMWVAFGIVLVMVTRSMYVFE